MCAVEASLWLTVTAAPTTELAHDGMTVKTELFAHGVSTFVQNDNLSTNLLMEIGAADQYSNNGRDVDPHPPPESFPSSLLAIKAGGSVTREAGRESRGERGQELSESEGGGEANSGEGSRRGRRAGQHAQHLAEDELTAYDSRQPLVWLGWAGILLVVAGMVVGAGYGAQQVSGGFEKVPDLYGDEPWDAIHYDDCDAGLATTTMAEGCPATPFHLANLGLARLTNGCITGAGIRLTCCDAMVDEAHLDVLDVAPSPCHSPRLDVAPSVAKGCPGAVAEPYLDSQHEPAGTVDQPPRLAATTRDECGLLFFPEEILSDYFPEGMSWADLDPEELEDPDAMSWDPAGVSSDEEGDDVGSFLGGSSEDELDDDLFVAGWSFEAPPISSSSRSAASYIGSRTIPACQRNMDPRQRSASAPEWSPGSDLSRSLPGTCAHCQVPMDGRSDVYIAMDQGFCSATCRGDHIRDELKVASTMRRVQSSFACLEELCRDDHC